MRCQSIRQTENDTPSKTFKISEEPPKINKYKINTELNGQNIKQSL